MKVIGNITKSGKFYNVNIKCDGFNVFKKTRLDDLDDAQEYLRTKKPEIISCTDSMRSYPEFEGKHVDYIIGEKTRKGIVVGCDYYIGITILDIDDRSKYLCCLRGPLSPQGKRISAKYPEKYNSYFAFFKNAIKCIHDGYYDSDYINYHTGTAYKNNGRATQSSCAFGV